MYNIQDKVNEQLIISWIGYHLKSKIYKKYRNNSSNMIYKEVYLI